MNLLETIIFFCIAWGGGFYVGWLARAIRADKERWARDDAEYEREFGEPRFPA